MKQFVFFVFLALQAHSFAQSPIQVASVETTIQFGQNKTDLYGFAAGDLVIIEYKTNKKALLALKFAAYESNVILQEALNKKGKKEIQIPKTGIYEFSVSNESRVNKSVEVSYTIKRIPKDETSKNFNTNVYWKDQIDTIVSIEKGKFPAGKDTSIVEIIEQTAKVHSGTNMNKAVNLDFESNNSTVIKFSLPKNTEAWSYYIGVDQVGAEKYQQAVKETAANLSFPLFKWSPTAALALNVGSFLTVAQNGEDINYCFIDINKTKQKKDETNLDCFKEGLVINDFARVTNKLEGNYKLILENDNLAMGVSVFVKITAIVVTDKFVSEREVRTLKTKKVAFLKG